MQAGCALGERARVGSAAVGQEAQEVDEFLIAVRDLRALDAGAVDELEE